MKLRYTFTTKRIHDGRYIAGIARADTPTKRYKISEASARRLHRAMTAKGAKIEPSPAEGIIENNYIFYWLY